MPSPLRPPKPPIGVSGGPLGAVLGALGPSGGLLGPAWDHLEASEAHRKRNGEKAEIMHVLQVVE
eukprot:3251995-Pyramimonas_sp.AAC.1